MENVKSKSIFFHLNIQFKNTENIFLKGSILKTLWYDWHFWYTMVSLNMSINMITPT